jgi:hypothetical protein
MQSHELSMIKTAVQQARSSVRGGTPDRRVDAIVDSLEAIQRWIEKSERDASMAGRGLR